MFVTHHSPVVDSQMRDRLWRLYARANGRIAETSSTHEILDRLEFDDHVCDHSSKTWVGWEGDTPIAMAVVSSDVSRMRWLSPQYFRRNYPRQFEAGLVHHLMWSVVDPVVRGASLFLSRQAMAAEQQEGALLVFELPEDHQPHQRGGGAELMHRLARMVGDADLVPLTAQRYFALDFSQETMATP